MKNVLVNLLKFGASFVILGYLVYDAVNDDTFAHMMEQPKHWGCFAGAWALCMLATCLTFVRWYYLVRALDLPFRMADAFRLGFIGYLWNFVSLGSVGGDLFKAVFIAREQPGKRAEAVATVFIDRVIGLYALFFVASVAALATGMISTEQRDVRILVQITLWCTVIGGIFITALVMPGFTNGRVSTWVSELPRVGPIFGRLLEAIRMYRTRPGVLMLTCLLSVLVHVLNTIGIYLIARGLPGEYPSMGAHFIIVSLGMLAGAIPLLPAGLGQFEGAMEILYKIVPGGANVAPDEGLVVAFGYRAITISIAIVGMVFYFRGRREVDAAWEEAEHIGDKPESRGANVGPVQPAGTKPSSRQGSSGAAEANGHKSPATITESR